MKIDREIAEKVMGYTIGKDLLVGYEAIFRQSSSTDTVRCDVWHPSTDIKQTFEVEEELRKRNLEYKYMKALLKVVAHAETIGDLTLLGLWNIIHATPEQRCLAALKAIKA